MDNYCRGPADPPMCAADDAQADILLAREYIRLWKGQ